jgi:hypothetical protein
MRRLCVFLLVLPLSGCAFFDDVVAFSDQEWHKFADDPNTPCNAPQRPARACGDGSIVQAGAQLPAQTAEPPR